MLACPNCKRQVDAPGPTKISGNARNNHKLSGDCDAWQAVNRRIADGMVDVSETEEVTALLRDAGINILPGRRKKENFDWGEERNAWTVRVLWVPSWVAAILCATEGDGLKLSAITHGKADPGFIDLLEGIYRLSGIRAASLYWSENLARRCT